MSCFRSCAPVLGCLLATFAHAQNQQQMPRDYRGVQTIVPGIFVTPVPNAPFSATVEILSHEILPDGTTNTHTTTAHISRSSSGRIYNERRQLVPATFKASPNSSPRTSTTHRAASTSSITPMSVWLARPSSLSLPKLLPMPFLPSLRSTIPTSSRRTSAPSLSAVLRSLGSANHTPSPLQ